MKTLQLLLLSFIFLFGMGVNIYSQNPTYTLDVNDRTVGDSSGVAILDFDIEMTWTNPGIAPNYELAGAQYFFDFNKGAIETGTSWKMFFIGSDLPASMQPRNPTVYTTTTPGQLRWAVNTFPGAGSGFVMPANTPVKIVRVRIKVIGGDERFAYAPLNLVWRSALPNPFTKIFAYVGTTNTDISTPATHTISINNDPLGGPYIYANFYSNSRTISQGQSINFFDSTLGSSSTNSWQWTFSGGTPSSSTERNPTNIRYDSPGTYDVSLSVWSDCCSDIETKTGYITVLPGCMPTWVQSIRITDAGSGNDSLKFGMAPDASNAIDTCFGELSLPPPPPLGVFDCRFVLPNNDASKKDLRQYANVDASWRMTFQPTVSGYPITFTWDIATLPAFGTFILKDEITGTLINVNMRNQNSYVLNLSGISSMKIDYYYSRTLTSSVNSGWNIVSVPVRAPDMTYSTLFPGVASQAFIYNNGYVPVTTLSNGAGYWMKFNNANNYLITGYKYQPENMYVSSGWNLIGPFDSNIPVSSIVSNPSGIVTSYYFGYGGSYAIADTLKVGKGYWIRTSASGYLYKGVMDNLQTQPAANPLEQFAELRLASGEDEHANLFLGMANELTSDYTLPPVPPSGIFDVRFGTDKFVEELGRNHVLKINSASRETKLTVHNTKGAKFRVKDAIDGSIIDKELVEGAEIIIPANLGTLLLETSAILPLTYELSQNYPNPFNPVTTIKYQLPKDGLVKIAVYDVLGKEVKSLVNGNQTAGAYEVRLDASSLASGVYFYRMTSGNFHKLKKMIVLK
jgi:PKD repeat protein